VNGIKFLLDTNFVLGVIKGTEPVVKALTERTVVLDECAHSFITRIELLSYSSITQLEMKSIENILSTTHYLSISEQIENAAIHIRRQHKLKIPDAIIAATAIALNVELLTLDQQLIKRMQDILEH
jgi:predicted nucleic acid-binding protein